MFNQCGMRVSGWKFQSFWSVVGQFTVSLIGPGRPEPQRPTIESHPRVCLGFSPSSVSFSLLLGSPPQSLLASKPLFQSLLLDSPKWDYLLLWVNYFKSLSVMLRISLVILHIVSLILRINMQTYDPYWRNEKTESQAKKLVWSFVTWTWHKQY